MLPDPRSGPGLPRRACCFRQDEAGEWVAELECGHTQHVRHRPPWQNRPWVLTPEGRNAYLGRTFTCLPCGREGAAAGGPPSGRSRSLR